MARQKLAFAPLFILWFGIGIESKIALVASLVFFIVYFATLNGVRALDTKLVQMAQIIGAAERQVSRHIVLPGAVPSFFFQAEDGIRDIGVTGVQTCALPFYAGGQMAPEPDPDHDWGRHLFRVLG